jgi:hypothetical protein
MKRLENLESKVSDIDGSADEQNIDELEKQVNQAASQGSVEDLTDRVDETDDKVDAVKVELQNMESEVEDIESRVSDSDHEELRQRLESVEGVISDIKLLFNDVDDLSQLKLLTADEYEELQQTDDTTQPERPDLEDLGALLERRFDALEEKFDQQTQTESSEPGDDLRLVVEELEDQNERMDDLGDAYQELGEMMKLVLQQLRSNPS